MRLADSGVTTATVTSPAERDVLDHDPGGTYPQSLAASWAVAFDWLAGGPWF